MANYDDLDETELQKMLGEAGSYEERSLIRQALRQKKKQRGGTVGRSKGGASGYNRFAGTARSAPAPKNYIVTSTETPSTEPVSQFSSSTSKQQVDIPPLVSPTSQESSPIPKPCPTPPPQESQAIPEPGPTPPSQESPPTPEPSPTPPLQPTPEPSPTPPLQPIPEPSPIPLSQESPPSPVPCPAPPSHELQPSSSSQDVDGGTDPGLGNEEGESVDEDTVNEPVTQTFIPQTKSMSVEEPDGSSGHSKHAPEACIKGSQPSVDFGVKLKKTAPQPKSKPSTRGSPRSLRDYQELASRSKASQPSTSENLPLEADELQKYLVAYVNKELRLSPPVPAKGRALFEVASDPSNLCKLINLSVPNTVDLRALTKMPVRGSADAKKEALEENMVLVVESARAIGCQVTEFLGDQIMKGDPTTIQQFLVDLIRARVVHLPGMDEEPSSTFTNMASLFSKLNISVDLESDGEALPTKQEVPSAKNEALTYEERAALRKAEREKKRTDHSSSNGPEMTYEERATQRKLERERRRKEREALAK